MNMFPKHNNIFYVIFQFLHFIIEFNTVVGKKNITSLTKIIGGYPCSIEEYSFIVSIRFKNNFGKHICGGTLVKPNWVLTAAHCLDFGRVTADELQVHIYTSSVMPTGTESTYVESFHIHPECREEDFHNDAALLKLRSSFMGKIKLIKLPLHPIDEDILIVCKEVLLMGWGSTNKWNPIEETMENSVSSFTGELNCVQIPVLSSKDCQNYFSFNIDPNSFCAMFEAGMKDSCLGDSGGPAICGEIQYGIISHAYGCGLKEEPSFNVRVDRMLDFINDVFVRSCGQLSSILENVIFLIIINIFFYLRIL